MTKYTATLKCESYESDDRVYYASEWREYTLTGKKVEKVVEFESPTNKRAKCKTAYIRPDEGFLGTSITLKNEETGETFRQSYPEWRWE